MWDEYRALRGLDEHGRPTPEAGARLARAELCDLALASLGARPVSGPGTGPGTGAATPSAGATPEAGLLARAPGVVEVRGLGPLAADVGQRTVPLALPATVLELVRELARCVPQAGPRLVARDLPVPAVLRDGHALAAGDLVHDGEHLDLVLAIAGGSA
jgi:hypothetical protein